MPNSSSSINLVKNTKIPLFDKFMNWALTAGRLIVIVTEVVALLAFVYRFSLDGRLIDLHDKIKQKQPLISLLKEDENKYKNLQDRIALASSLLETNTKTNKIVLDIAGLISQEVRVDNLFFNKDRITINTSMNSVSALTKFIDILKGYPNIKTLSIDTIENKSSGGLSVTVTTLLK